MKIISVQPRGYCHGVIRAIRLAQKTKEKYPNTPITILGMLVHNQHVVDVLAESGMQTIEDKNQDRLSLLDKIQEGIVLFTAHGVSPAVYQKAKEKGLQVVDATCPDVLKTHELIKDYADDVIYLGKKNHPESEGTVGLSKRVHLVSNLEDLKALQDIEIHNPIITNQTTLSLLDLQDLIEACLKQYPNAKVVREICPATRLRQEAILNLEADALYVVGDVRSNNSNQLAIIARKIGIPFVKMISSVNDIQESELIGKERIAITSGSSTPNALTNQVVSFLQEYEKTGKFELPVELNRQLL
ncbi:MULTISPECIES: 4-hydroxy-3-methylbut-2-enyl diphosphate reductase [Terrabacteria group]|uniref:4-hydroxy-3-methylbut-2-enyl diphosphate reductase n=1 Tax=Bacillati TaxID=1783272 RepID=UPI0019392FFF|nr:MULTISPECIES: 4-hydroxy-3-methylbut-2-enyl diphosphate reductase [Terrabacteria group]MBW9212394.1 4-hydroxy-3-methylbut-2-enyl diphosphate reductase [Trueperella sp. zg.1013]QRG86031.1 4-hydroxy-3-methylbut-2-enyl diphosphate reductase [Bulleidia sp. zg-1006]